MKDGFTEPGLSNFQPLSEKDSSASGPRRVNTCIVCRPDIRTLSALPTEPIKCVCQTKPSKELFLRGVQHVVQENSHLVQDFANGLKEAMKPSTGQDSVTVSSTDVTVGELRNAIEVHNRHPNLSLPTRCLELDSLCDWNRCRVGTHCSSGDWIRGRRL